MIFKNNKFFFNHLIFIEKATFLLILFIPLSFFLGTLIINLILTLFFIIFIIQYKNFKKNNLIYKIEFKILIFFCIYIIINSILNELTIVNFLKSFSYLRFPVLIFIFFYCFQSLSNKKKNLWVNLNLIFLFVILSDLFFQYFVGYNLIGFSPGMCEEDYLTNKSICTRYSGFFKDELIMGGYLSTIFLSIILFSVSIKKNWFIFLVSIILMLYVSIMITGERSATITISLTLIFTFIQYKGNIKIKLLYFSFLSLITAVMIFLNPHLKGRYIDFFTYDMKDTGSLTIFEKIATTPWGLHAQKSLRLIIDEPLTGHGIKSFRQKCKNFALYVDREKKKHNPCSTHPHNLILELLTEQGFLGFCIFFTFFFLILRRSFIDHGFFSNNFSLISLRSLIFVLIFIPKPTGSIFSSINATMIWFCVSLFVFQIYSKNKFLN